MVRGPTKLEPPRAPPLIITRAARVVGRLEKERSAATHQYLSAHIRHAVATGVERRIREAPSSSGTLREGSVRAWQPLPACSERRLAPPCTLWKEAPPTLKMP